MAFLLTIALAQPVNFALALESDVGSSGTETVSVDAGVSPMDTGEGISPLGISPSGTATVVEKLPSALTLSFHVAAAGDCNSSAARPNISGHEGTADDPFIIAEYADLLCMQELVNNNVTFTVDADTYTYRADKHWQFDSFDASGETFSPIGTAASPFSGYIVGDGPVSVSNLTISGTDSVGLLGVTEGFVSIKDMLLKDVTVNGANSVGAWVGSAGEGVVELTDVSVTGEILATGDNVGGVVGHIAVLVTAENVSVSGEIRATGNQVGGVVGQSGGLDVNGVSIWGTVSGADVVGGLVGQAGNTATLKKVVFDGSVAGNNSLGGLLGVATDMNTTFCVVEIAQASVNLTVSSTGSGIGGLVGTFEGAYNAFKVDDALVVGSIAGSSSVAGLVGIFSSNDFSPELQITRVVNAVELRAENNAVAGLLNNNATKFDYVALQSVLNLARVVSSAAGFSQAAALVYSDSTPWNLSVKQAYHWQGLSASAATYHPFTIGTVTGTPWKNGDAVNCSNFSDSNFWTDSSSMGLSDTNGWNFDSIADGYLPSLNGQFVDVPFSCMNEITYQPDWGSAPTVQTKFGDSATIPITDNTASVAHYFLANSDFSTAIYQFNVSDQAPFDIFYNGTVAKCQMTNGENWQLPAAGLFLDSTISLRTSECSEVDFGFKLAKSNRDLLLSWTANDAQSVSVIFTTLTNLAGGTPPGISAEQFAYEGSDTAYTWNLGPAYVGTYVISVSGSVLWNGKTQSFAVAGTSTWTDRLQEVTPEASVSFADVFTGSAGTVTYKHNGKVTVSRVAAVNASRYAAIRWLGSVGVTVGSQSNNAGKTTYRPQDSVNRGAMAQFLQKLAGFSNAQIAAQYQGQTTDFTDIDSLLKSNPARYYAILWLADTGITAGCNAAGTEFCPVNTVNRGAMAEFLRKFAGLAATSASTSPFPDVNLTDMNVKYDGFSKSVKVTAVNDARMGAINWMYSTGITLGSGTSGSVTTYRPQDPVNRGAMAEFMRRLALLVGSTK